MNSFDPPFCKKNLFLLKRFFIPKYNNEDRGSDCCYYLSECNVCLGNFDYTKYFEYLFIKESNDRILHTKLSKETNNAFNYIFNGLYEITIVLMDKLLEYKDNITNCVTYNTIISNPNLKYNEILKLCVWFLTYKKYGVSYFDENACTCNGVCVCKAKCEDHELIKFALFQFFACIEIIKIINGFDFDESRFKLFEKFCKSVKDKPHITIGVKILTSSELFPDAKKDFVKFYQDVLGSVKGIEEAEVEAEAEAKRIAEAEAKRIAEAEAKRIEEAEAKRIAEAEAKRIEEAEAKRIAEAEAKRIAEAEAKRIAEAEAKRIAEAETDTSYNEVADFFNCM